MIQVDTEPGFNGLSDIRKILAVSDDIEKLTEYTKHKFNMNIGKPDKINFDRYYYLIEPTEILILY